MNHYAVAEELLASAAQDLDSPRIGVARTKAEMAQAHATLALVKATRQGHELVWPDVAPVESTEAAS